MPSRRTSNQNKDNNWQTRWKRIKQVCVHKLGNNFKVRLVVQISILLDKLMKNTQTTSRLVMNREELVHEWKRMKWCNRMNPKWSSSKNKVSAPNADKQVEASELEKRRIERHNKFRVGKERKWRNRFNKVRIRKEKTLKLSEEMHDNILNSSPTRLSS